MELYKWREIKTVEVETNIAKFLECLKIWILKPASVIKRAAGVDIFKLGSFSTVDNVKNTLNVFLKIISEVNDSLNKEDFFTILNGLGTNKNSKEYEMFARVLYPRSGHFSIFNMDIVIKDFTNNMVIFIKALDKENLILPYITYGFILDEKNLKLVVDDNFEETSLNWVSCTLFPKILNWIEVDLHGAKMISHSLVPAEKYLSKYSDLKAKYSKALMEMWTECTDPQKFIYEDIAIATYLILLWGEEEKRFIDIGCGNGLLVYILNGENHHGIGIDVRSRKIWAKYRDLPLKECTISPSLDLQLPETDWIIGNHSDELTPWIPVMAATNSYSTNFFLLPCCPYDFNGRKYVRCNTSKSQYLDYIDYVENICEISGFKVQKDRLKIPSTKRICFVSKGRLHKESDSFTYINKVKKLIDSKINNEKQIKLRETKERVRNCTQINKNIINSIISRITLFLLSGPVFNDSWMEGRSVDIKELVNILPKEELQELKSECGGIQTLLKNHQDIFCIKNGLVQLRKPSIKSPRPKVWKKKPCWFFLNHPNSCPLEDKDCSYKHD